MSISICISNTFGSSKWYFCLSSQRVGWSLLHVPGMPLIQLQKQRSISICISICIDICISICISSGARNVINTITKQRRYILRWLIEQKNCWSNLVKMIRIREIYGSWCEYSFQRNVIYSLIPPISNPTQAGHAYLGSVTLPPFSANTHINTDKHALQDKHTSLSVLISFKLFSDISFMLKTSWKAQIFSWL